MHEYELALIISPDVEPESVESIAETLTQIITEAGGEIQQMGQLANNTGKIVERPEGDWQKRKLAYPVKKQTEGYYLILQIKTTPDVIPAVERNLALNELVMRQLLLRKEE